MIQKFFFAAIIMAASVSAGMAGIINDGTWSPSACDTEPAVPVIEQSSIDDYNKSIKAINEWQQKANVYNTCLINEANADNALIAKAANEGQGRLRAAIEKIKTEMEAAKAKLEKK